MNHALAVSAALDLLDFEASADGACSDGGVSASAADSVDGVASSETSPTGSSVSAVISTCPAGFDSMGIAEGSTENMSPGFNRMLGLFS